jgi:hypothetical protein
MSGGKPQVLLEAWKSHCIPRIIGKNAFLLNGVNPVIGSTPEAFTKR